MDLRLWHEVTSVDFDAKTVNVKDLKSGEEFVQSYDKLLIATGSRPIVPPVEGRELQGVYVLKTIPEAEIIKAALLKDEAKRIAIIGGGFIGMEMAEAVTLRGRKALLFESMPHVMGGYDELFQEALEDNLRKHGVELHLGETVSRIEGEGGVAQAHRHASGLLRRGYGRVRHRRPPEHGYVHGPRSKSSKTAPS